MGSLRHSWLEGLETPYLWRPSELLDPRGQTNLLHRLQDRERESRDNEKDLTFSNFVIQLLLGYELFAASNDVTAATSRLGELEMDLFRMDIVSNCSFYLQVRRAQWHTMLASRAVLLACLGRLDESRQVVRENFDPISVFNSAEMSAIYGIKSGVYLEYGPTAWPEALRWAKEAMKINSKEAEWHFLAGRALENIRLDNGNCTGIPKEELHLFEGAVALGGRGDHMIHLANLYDRIARQIQMGNIKNEEMDILVKNLTLRSYELLQKSLKSAGNNTEIRLRCLKGLLRQPHRTLVKEDLRRFMEELLSETKKINLFFNVAGKYYLKLEKDNQTAVRYFEEGSELGDYACSVSALRLRHNLGQVPDPELALRHLVARYENQTHHEDALCHLGAWLMLGKRDMAAALGVFNTVLEHNPRCRSLVVHKPLFVHCPSPLNLLHVLYNEVRLAPAGALTPNEKDNFLKCLSTHNPTVCTPVDP